MKKVALIGCGSMGSALARAIVGQDEVVLTVCDHHSETLEKMEVLGARAVRSSGEALDDADVVLLAIKPHGLDSLAQELGRGLGDRLLISVLAGASIDRLQEALGAQRVVRAMPNLGVQVGDGVVGWAASPAVTRSDRQLISQLFSPLGYEFFLEKETMLDAVTALSGSGPAYFFHLCTLLERKAVQMGLSQKQARLLAERTLRGAGQLLGEGCPTAAEWSVAVTSKGGTTEAALAVLQDSEFSTIFSSAVDAAYHRASTLCQNP